MMIVSLGKGIFVKREKKWSVGGGRREGKEIWHQIAEAVFNVNLLMFEWQCDTTC